MKKSVKAALLSGLVFPGIGHLALRKYLRGSILLVMSLVAFSIVATRAYQQALLISEQIISGNIPVETEAITQAVSNSADSANNLVGSIATGVLVACWLAGIIDSYRLGAELDQ